MKSWLRRSFRQEKSSSKFGFFLWAILLGLLVGVASVWSSNKDVLGLFHDDGIYAVVAKSLSDGSGYRIISLPTAPDQTKYPFLYSYILSWLWSLDPKFPDNIGLLKAANAVFLSASFVLSYFFYRRRIEGEESEALLFAALVCINRLCFRSQILPSVTSCFFCFVSVRFCDFRFLGAVYFADPVVTLLAALVGLGCLTRSAGVSAGSGRGLSFRMGKRYRDLTLLCRALCFYLLPPGGCGLEPIQTRRRVLLNTMVRTVRNSPRL